MVGDFYHDCQWVVFITQKGKKIVAPEVNPQKISPCIKSTIRSYLSHSLVNWKRALFTLLHMRYPGHPPVSPISIHTHPKQGYSPDATVGEKGGGEERKRLSRSRHHLYLLFEKKPDFGTCCFPSLELCVNGHVFTLFSHYYALHSTISQLMSHPPLRLVLMVITPGRFWRASIHLHKKQKQKKPMNSQILESLLWSLAIFVDAFTPVCFPSKYFLGVTRVRTVATSPARLICPLSCTAPVFASMTHFTFLIKKKDGKAGECV